MTEWEGRLAVVTGAASGIGLATARALAARGCSLAVADRDRDGLQRLEDEWRNTQRAPVDIAELDVAAWDDVREWADAVCGRLGVPHYFVANAGVNPEIANTAAIEESDWDRILAVNLKGVFAGCRRFLPAMAGAGRGAVVMVASVAGLVGWGGTSAYCASKAGVIGLTRSLAVEYAPNGVRVNSICPGAVLTDMVRERVAHSADPQRRLEVTASKHLLGRLARAEEIAAAILFALSDDSSFMTGSVLTVDGGVTAI